MGDVLKFRPRPKPEGPQKTIDYDNFGYPRPADEAAAMALVDAISLRGVDAEFVRLPVLCGDCIKAGPTECQSPECGLYGDGA